MNCRSFLIFLFVFSVFIGICCGEAPLVNNGDGSYSFENGFFLREYPSYPEDCQLYLSMLDACYSGIGAYSEIIDPYISGEKSFSDGQWNVIDAEVRYMSAYACSWVMQSEVPAGLSAHATDAFNAAAHLLTANGLLLDALEANDENAAEIASWYYAMADEELEWWKRE